MADEVPQALVGALEAASVRWVDAPWDVERAELKQNQLAVAKRLGVPIPRSLVTNDPGRAQAFYRAVGGAVAKALSSGPGIAPFVAEVPYEELGRVAESPTLLQEPIDAFADCRVVTVAGRTYVWRRVRGAGDPLDWRQADPDGTGFLPHEDDAVAAGAQRMNVGLGLSVSVQDWLLTAEGPVFLEANPVGDWLFLYAASDTIPPLLADHLTLEGNPGIWPSWWTKLGIDFLPTSKAPPRGGIAAPAYHEAAWTRTPDAATEQVLATASLAREKAEARIASAEGRGTRLAQTGLTLLATVLALSGFEAGRLRGAHAAAAWYLAMIPAVLAVVCLTLVVVQAIGVDGVGTIGGAAPEDVSAQAGLNEQLREQIRQESYAAQVANWCADRKLDEVLRARAWLTRALAATTLAAVVAVFTWVLVATPGTPAPAPPTPSPLATASPGPLP